MIREPPHQQQSQQHNFAAPRKGIFNVNNNSSAANAHANKDLNQKQVQNNKDHNKENLTAGQKKSETNDIKLNANVASGSGNSAASGPAVATSAATVTAGNGPAKK